MPRIANKHNKAIVQNIIAKNREIKGNSEYEGTLYLCSTSIRIRKDYTNI